MTKHLQKHTPFNFNDGCGKSFNELKLASTHIYPPFNESFLIDTDASAFSNGAILFQGPIGKTYPWLTHLGPFAKPNLDIQQSNVNFWPLFGRLNTSEYIS